MPEPGGQRWTPVRLELAGRLQGELVAGRVEAAVRGPLSCARIPPMRRLSALAPFAPASTGGGAVLGRNANTNSKTNPPWRAGD